MKYIKSRNDIVLSDYDSFIISQTLECGQCFRFEKLEEENYVVIAFGRILNIYQDGNSIVFKNTSAKDFEDIWIKYFDLERDYNNIKETISKNDSVLEEAISYAPGIRIISQERFECLISFIISQNNRIPMIKKVIENISVKFGKYIGSFMGKDYYSFPIPCELSKADVESLMECKTGFRAKYIMDAVDKVLNKKIDLSVDDKTEVLRENLMSIKGVGNKVSDCVLMFSYGKVETFPTDVWIKRIMSELYFDGIDTSINDIHKLAQENFGQYAGYAQQYLFNYARQFEIGV